ncbi:hypothetical protein QL285_009600 [Trifolium repens]|nr:hypothetical protein QL285_009600 [Trifolium repens]
MRITSTPNGTSPSDSNDSPCAEPHPIVQLSPSFLVVESFKTRTILNHLRETRTFVTQFNPTTILIHREPYRTLSHKNAISIELIPYSNFNLIEILDEDDEFVMNETFDPNSHSICNPKRFLIFHTSFL